MKKNKSRSATLCALVRAGVSLHFHLPTSRIFVKRFCVIGNAVSYDIKNRGKPLKTSHTVLMRLKIYPRFLLFYVKKDA